MEETTFILEKYMSLVPMVITKTSQGERVMDIYSRLLEQRIIVIASEIDDLVCTSIIAQLLHLDAEDPDKDITIQISSPGGSVLAGLMLTDTIQVIRPKVNIIGMGSVASMGAYILASGTGIRRALPNARIMIHQVSSGYQGKFDEMTNQIKETEKLHNLLEANLSKFTGQPLKKIHEDCRMDHFMSAKESLDYGIIDEIIQPRIKLRTEKKKQPTLTEKK